MTIKNSAALFLVLGVLWTLISVHAYTRVELKRVGSDMTMRDVKRHLFWLSIGRMNLDDTNLDDKEKALIFKVFRIFRFVLSGVAFVFFLLVFVFA